MTTPTIDEHLEAVKAQLASLGYTTWLFWADEVSRQYVVLDGRSWDRPAEMPVAQLTDDLDTEFRVKAVAGTTSGAAIMLNRLRALLSPQLGPTQIPMAGRAVTVVFVRGEFIDVDQSTTIASTGRHPAVGVDTYRLVSQPV